MNNELIRNDDNNNCRYMLYRYLNTLHFFAYAYLVPDFASEANQFPLRVLSSFSFFLASRFAAPALYVFV
jgi:hypothetical protein